MLRWHRAGWKLFWWLKSRSAGPQIPQQIHALIRRIAKENPSSNEERIANELLLNLGTRVSARIASKYLLRHPSDRPRGGLRWSTFVRLHARGIFACDFSSPSPRPFDCCACSVRSNIGAVVWAIANELFSKLLRGKAAGPKIATCRIDWVALRPVSSKPVSSGGSCEQRKKQEKAARHPLAIASTPCTCVF